MPEFLLPFGPFHMVMLHLPIGALTAIWFLEILLENKGDKHKNQAIGLLQLLLLLSCALTIVLGLSYAEFGRYGDEIDTHELWGYIFGGCVLVTYLCYWINRLVGKRGSKLLYMLSLLAATIAMAITGHQGGELIHGKGFLTKPFKNEIRRTAPATTPEVETSPPPLSSPTSSLPSQASTLSPQVSALSPQVSALSPQVSAMEPMEPMMDTAEGTMSGAMVPAMPAHASAQAEADPSIALFESSQAIFKRHCYKCHGATKQKGDYRLDNKHSINLGGKSDLPAIVPGDAQDSELMYRMQLPRDDDDVMPPEEKDPVSSEEIETVRQWIEAGAYWPDEAELNSAPGDYIETGDADTDQLIEQISSTGVKAEYNAWGDDSIRIDLGVVEPGQLDQAIQQLSGFSNKLTWLDCSQLKLPDHFFTQLQQFNNLERLHLDGSNVTDQQLKQLSTLPKLSYLNLYNTEISDTGLDALQNCAQLKKIFLSQTTATPAGIAQLKSALPEIEVIYH